MYFDPAFSLDLEFGYSRLDYNTLQEQKYFKNGIVLTLNIMFLQVSDFSLTFMHQKAPPDREIYHEPSVVLLFAMMWVWFQ